MSRCAFCAEESDYCVCPLPDAEWYIDMDDEEYEELDWTDLTDEEFRDEW